MAGYRDPANAKAWRDRLRRFKRSRLTVVEFCSSEDVSVPSFYQWRKKLAAERVSRQASRIRRAGFQQVTVHPVSQAVLIRFPGGTRMELPSENCDVIRTIVQELGRGGNRENGGAPC